MKHYHSAPESGQEKKSGLIQDSSGKYRWVYELPMRKSLFLLLEVWKVLAMSVVIVLFISAIINLCSGSGIAGVWGSIVSILIPSGIIFVLSLPAYYIVTKANNGVYTVLFEMDDSGIDHIQIKTEKAKALDLLSVFVGAAVRQKTTTAAGLLSASGGTLYTRFSDVRKVRAYPERRLITLNGRLFRNQVYTDPCDFDFVCDYIVSRCQNADIRR